MICVFSGRVGGGGGALTWPPKVIPRELACWGMMSCVMWARVKEGGSLFLAPSPIRDP